MNRIRFDEFEIDLNLFTLSADSAPIHIGPKAFDVLVFLIENRDRVVSQDEIRENVWGPVSLSQAAIPTCVLAIRRALGDDAGSPRLIQSARARGYRFIGRVIQTEADRFSLPEESPFVGRSALLASIRKLSKRVVQSRIGHIALVSGEAGIGKTRLLAEVRNALDENFDVFRTRAAPPIASLPFRPWSQLIESALARERDENSPLETCVLGLSQYFPEVLGNETDKGIEDRRAYRHEVFSRWSRAVFSIPGDKPVAILIDDAHQLDEDSLLLLYWICEELERHPILIIAVHRPNLPTRNAADIFEDIGALPNAETQKIPPLSIEDVCGLLSPFTTDKKKRATDLVARTRGNAFYITHLLRSSLKEEATPLDEVNPTALAMSAEKVVAKQLSGLPTKTKSALAAASVLGDEFDAMALSSSIPDSIDLTSQALEHALRAWILSESSGTYSFRHSILRESLYNSLAPSTRRETHLRVARFLERQGSCSNNPAEIVHHLLSALPLGDARHALHQAISASEMAASRFAYSESRNMLETALELSKSQPDSSESETCSILISLAQSVLYCGERQRSRELLVEAARIARSGGLSHQLAPCALALAPDFLAMEVGVFDSSLVQLLEEAISAININDHSVRSKLLSRLSQAKQWGDSLKERESLAAEALSIAESIGDDSALTSALAAYADTLNGPKNATARLSAATKLGTAARRARDIPEIFLHHTRKISAYMELGWVESAESENRKHKDLAAQVRLPQYEWIGIATDAMLATVHGDLDRAEALGAEYLAVAGEGLDANVTLTHVGQSVAWQIERDQTKQLVTAVREFSASRPNVRFWRAIVTWVLTETGHDDDAKAQLNAFSAKELRDLQSEPGGGLGLALISEVAAILGTDRQRHMLLDAVLPIADRCASGGYGVAYCGSFSRYAGLLQLALGRSTSAVDLLKASLEHEERCRAPSWALYSASDLIRAQRESGQDIGPIIERTRSILVTAQNKGLARACRKFAEVTR